MLQTMVSSSLIISAVRPGLEDHRSPKNRIRRYNISRYNLALSVSIECDDLVVVPHADVLYITSRSLIYDDAI